jgi:exosortase E/protease (VPEID-CTERM system)
LLWPDSDAAEPRPVLRRAEAPSFSFRLTSLSFAKRILLLALLFAAELIVISIWLDGASLVQRAGLIGIMSGYGAWILRGVVGFAAIFVTFAYLKNKAELERISSQSAHKPIEWGLLAAHFCALVVFVGLSSLLYGRSGSQGSWLAVCWFGAGITAIAFAGFAFVPWKISVHLVRGTGLLWLYASMAVVSACFAGYSMDRWLWEPTSRLTFRLTKLFLSFFVSDIIANPATMVVGTHRFSVNIAPQCSGLEGIGLMLAFGVLWLLLSRKECRFPQSLVLIPLGAALMFLLNAVRIGSLILIGNAGARQIATGGFHSQAGWIAFTGVAVGFCFATQHIPGLRVRPLDQGSVVSAIENPTAAFLLPFLVILAAGMIATAFAGGFEWLYPLRFFAAAGVLWAFRRTYRGMNWSCSWMAPVLGALVFVIWIGLDHFSNPSPDHGVPAALLASSVAGRATWIAFRVLAAVITVPLAEELAFRGFLMRRLVSPQFDSISFRRFTWFALLVSSIAFGLLHGGHWIAGSIAGMLFALAVIRSGSMGDAVVAHATANALLAAYVLLYHQWHLW